MLEELRQDVRKLISLYEGEKHRADELERKLNESKQEVETCRLQITKLNRQVDNLQLSGIFAPEGNSKLAKERINKLIREIDKCIALMEK